MVLNRAKPHKWSMRQTKENNGKHHFSGISAVTGFIWHFLYNRNKTFLKNWKKNPEKSNKKNILHHLMAANTLKSTHDNKLFHRLDKVDFLCNFTMIQKYSLWVVQEIFWLFETVQSCVEKYGTKGLQRQMGSHKTYQKMMSFLTWILALYLTVEQISCSFSQTGVYSFFQLVSLLKK